MRSAIREFWNGLPEIIRQTTALVGAVGALLGAVATVYAVVVPDKDDPRKLDPIEWNQRLPDAKKIIAAALRQARVGDENEIDMQVQRIMSMNQEQWTQFLSSQGEWREDIIKEMPFGLITINNPGSEKEEEYKRTVVRSEHFKVHRGDVTITVQIVEIVNTKKAGGTPEAIKVRYLLTPAANGVIPAAVGTGWIHAEVIRGQRLPLGDTGAYVQLDNVDTLKGKK